MTVDSVDFWSDFTRRSRTVPVPDAPEAALAPAAAPNHSPPPARAVSLLRDDLHRIAERFREADARAFRAAVAEAAGERDQADAEKAEAAGDFWAATAEAADLLLLLLRLALKHRPDALRAYLVDALREGPQR